MESLWWSERPLGVIVPPAHLRLVLPSRTRTRRPSPAQSPGSPSRPASARFWSVLRTHSPLRASTTSSFTGRSASIRTVQRQHPAGGWLPARARRWVCWASSSVRYCRPVDFLRNNAPSRPSSTNAWRARCMVDRRTPKTSAMSSRRGSGRQALLRRTREGCRAVPRTDAAPCRGEIGRPGPGVRVRLIRSRRSVQSGRRAEILPSGRRSSWAALDLGDATCQRGGQALDCFGLQRQSPSGVG